MLTPQERWELNCTSYRNCIREAMSRGDKETAEKLQQALRKLEQSPPDAAPGRGK